MFLIYASLLLVPAILADDDHDPKVICDFLAQRVGKLHQELDAMTCAADSDMTTMAMCDEIGKVIPFCMKKDSHAAQDSCMENIAARKYGSMSGHEAMECCKEKEYTKFLNQLQDAHRIACPAKTSAARRRRSLYPSPGYGVNTIWFQYHLCQELGFNCWFFTQGWGQEDFGSYYLYDELLGDDGLDLDNEFLTLALLGGGLGIGGGGQHGSVYPSRYRRSEEQEDYDDSADYDDETGRNRRSDDLDYGYEDYEDESKTRRSVDDCKLRVEGDCVDE